MDFEKMARELLLRYSVGTVKSGLYLISDTNMLCILERAAIEGAKAMQGEVLKRKAFNVPYIVTLDPASVVREAK